MKEYSSDGDRTCYSAAVGYCPRCGRSDVAFVTGDMGFFYQCVWCGSGVWEDFSGGPKGEDCMRCAWCGTLMRQINQECPRCGRWVGYPVKNQPKRNAFFDVVFPGPQNLYKRSGI